MSDIKDPRRFESDIEKAGFDARADSKLDSEQARDTHSADGSDTVVHEIHEIPEPDPEIQKRILRKFDWIMLPLLALFYLWYVQD